MRRLRGSLGFSGNRGSTSARPLTSARRVGGGEAHGGQRFQGGAGALAGQVPIALRVVGEGGGIGVAPDRDLVVQGADGLDDFGQELPHVVVHLRAAEGEHALALVIDDLDAHALRRLIDQKVVLEALGVGGGFQRLLEGLGRLVELALLALLRRQGRGSAGLGRRPGGLLAGVLSLAAILALGAFAGAAAVAVVFGRGDKGVGGAVLGGEGGVGG
jgi:hypothetical protein